MGFVGRSGAYDSGCGFLLRKIGGERGGMVGLLKKRGRGFCWGKQEWCRW